VTRAAEDYARVAREAGLEPAHLALAFVRSRAFVASTVVGATTVKQLEANLASRSVALAADTFAAIDAVNARYPSPSAGL
jgi:aryl-alcohol dehydrogenase-like predicted oxidoreductase